MSLIIISFEVSFCCPSTGLVDFLADHSVDVRKKCSPIFKSDSYEYILNKYLELRVIDEFEEEMAYEDIIVPNNGFMASVNVKGMR